MALQNLRYAFRLLLRTPGITAAAIVCLALGIGATTAIFSVVNAVLLRKLPYAHSERLVRVFTEFPNFPNGGLRHFWMSAAELLDLRRDAKSWDNMEAWQTVGVTLAGGNDAVRAMAAVVTGGMLPMLGAKPLIGRVIEARDDVPNAPTAAVLSYGLWQRAYGGDAGVLGRDVLLNGKTCRVIGVMDAGFEFPPAEVDKAELWVPAGIDPAKPGGRGSHQWSVLARLKAGVSFKQAEDELLRLAQAGETAGGPQTHSFSLNNHPIVLTRFQDEVVKNVRLSMLVLLGAVVFVLLIASVNVANLLLARAESRRREIAVRKAIGAGLATLLGQFIVEGILLSALGAMLGLGLAYAGLRLIVNTNPGSLPRSSEIHIDGMVLLFAIGISVLTGLVFGFAPLMHLVGQDLHTTLKAAAGKTTAGAGSGRFRSALVAMELALALILLIGAGLMVKTFWKLQNVNAGFEPGNVLTARVSLPSAAYATPQGRRAFWSSLRSRMQNLPEVVSASWVQGLPPVRTINANDTQIEGFVPRKDGPLQNVDYWNTVGAGYFETMRIHLIDGRLLDDRDGENAPQVVVINQTMARTFWPGQSVIGRRIRPGFQDPWRTVVGVVADVKNAALDRPAGAELYFPAAQGATPLGAYVVLRTKGDPGRAASGLRQQVREIDRSIPVSAVRSMDDVMAGAMARPRFLSVLLGLFSMVAAVLASVGIFGVLSYSVAQRTNELGIRMALGANPGRLMALVLREGLVTALVGTLIGGLGALALTRVMQGLLFQVSAFDLGTFLSMAAVLIAVTLLACYLPARRASAVDPMVALRYE